MPYGTCRQMMYVAHLYRFLDLISFKLYNGPSILLRPIELDTTFIAWYGLVLISMLFSR